MLSPKKKSSDSQSVTISFDDNLVLPVIFGEHDKNLKTIEQELGIVILPRGNFLKLIGNKTVVKLAKNVLEQLYNLACKSNNIGTGEIIGTINILKNKITNHEAADTDDVDSFSISAGKKIIKPRSSKQLDYFDLVKKKTNGVLLRSCWNRKNILGSCLCSFNVKNRANR